MARILSLEELFNSALVKLIYAKEALSEIDLKARVNPYSELVITIEETDFSTQFPTKKMPSFVVHITGTFEDLTVDKKFKLAVSQSDYNYFTLFIWGGEELSESMGWHEWVQSIVQDPVKITGIILFAAVNATKILGR